MQGDWEGLGVYPERRAHAPEELGVRLREGGWQVQGRVEPPGMWERAGGPAEALRGWRAHAGAGQEGCAAGS